MKIKTVGIFSIGEMGQSVSKVLTDHGLRVVTSLSGRSETTRRRAGEVGVVDLESVAQVVSQAEIILSTTHSSGALDVGKEVAGALRKTGDSVLFADLNSIAPETTHDIDIEITGAGGRYVDGSIIGSATNLSGATFYASGPYAADFAALKEYGLNTVVLGGQIGQASAFKVIYAGFTKGVTSLMLELLLGAQAAGILELVIERYRRSFPEIVEFVDHFLPNTMARAERRSQEMSELSTALDGLGIQPLMADSSQQSLKELAGLGLDGDALNSAQEAIEAIYKKLTSARVSAAAEN